MSKYKELCHVYSVARKNYFDYWDECADFIAELVSGLKKYMEIPKENIRYAPLKEKPEFGKMYKVKETMHLEQDTYWYTGIMLTLCGELDDQPEETIILPFLVKKIDSVFSVKLGQDSDEFQIDIKDEKSCNDFYGVVYDQINNSYNNRLQKFLSEAVTERRIGFAAE